MNSMNREELLRLIKKKESEYEPINKLIVKFKNEIEEIIKKNSWNAEFFLGGSVAKGTDLLDSDLDFFILFHEYFNPKEVIEVLKTQYKDAVENYSEHPYITLVIDNREIDIVPAFYIEEGEKIKTSVDRTPLHVKFIKYHLSELQKDEARILKYFFKKIGVYGAESSVRGFSGYAAELLIYKFGDFDKVLGFFKNQSPPIIIDIPGISDKNYSKFQEPLVLIDPVDLNRNVTANVSIENLWTLIAASKLFSWENSEKFFNPKQRTYKVPENAIALVINCKKCKEDVVVSNLRRVAQSIINNAKIYGFKIEYFSTLFLTNSGMIVFLPESNSLGSTYLHKGPKIDRGNLEDFANKWINNLDYGPPLIIGDTIYVIAKRKFINFNDYLKREIEKLKLAGDFDRTSIKIIGPEEIEKLIKNGIIDRPLTFLV